MKPIMDWKGFEEDRKQLKKAPKNIRNLLDYMRASASIGQVYDYLEAFEKELVESFKDFPFDRDYFAEGYPVLNRWLEEHEKRVLGDADKK